MLLTLLGGSNVTVTSMTSDCDQDVCSCKCGYPSMGVHDILVSACVCMGVHVMCVCACVSVCLSRCEEDEEILTSFENFLMSPTSDRSDLLQRYASQCDYQWHVLSLYLFESVNVSPSGIKQKPPFGSFF